MKRDGKMERQQLFKKLNRKLKRAIRLGEPYEQWLTQMKRLDDRIAAETPGWVKGAYLNALNKV